MKNYIISYYTSGDATYTDTARRGGKLVISAESYTCAYLTAVFSLPMRAVITDVCEY